jgi:UDP-N-acetylmuramoyl-L-alanyl-D-glutamate--2,6-diaminopimelate ligase
VSARHNLLEPAAQAIVNDSVDWLRAHCAAPADLHADSRTLQAGDAFMAYAVDGADNRSHIDAAFVAGAAAVLYQPEGFPGSTPAASHALPVPALNVLAGSIASGWYGAPSEALLAIGVTGTNGKTSCSYWLAQALSATGLPCAVIGTLGIGLPAAPGGIQLTGFTTPDAPQVQRHLARLRDAGARAVALEVSSHGLHQGRVNGTEFDIAVFTNLSQDHLDYHGTLQIYEAAKGRLFDWPSLTSAVVNRDDAAGCRLLARLSGKVRTIAYGIGPDAADRADAPADALLRADGIRPTAIGTAFRLSSDWGPAELEVPLLGAFNVSNALAVLGALLAAGVPFAAALAELARLEPVAGRMQRLGGRASIDEPLVVIDYAHTPDALEKTLAALRPVATERGGALVCMFGCGGDRDAGKRPLMGAIAERDADAVVLTSDNPRTEAPLGIIEQVAAGMRDPARVRCIEDRASAILQTIRAAQREDVVVLAGKGHEATQEIMGRKRPFSDQDHARLALAARVTQTRGDSA